MDTISKRILRVIIFVIFLIMTIQFYWDISAKEQSKEQFKKIIIEYPKNKTIFPPDFHIPTFVWLDSTDGVNNYQISINYNKHDTIIDYINGNKRIEWKPSKELWEKIKSISNEKQIKIEIIGLSQLTKKPLSYGKLEISTSIDSVNSPIFYRDVPLPFSYALRNLEEVKWRLGYVSSDTTAKIVMEKLPVCANCHSFSNDGKTFAMDVDAHSGKDAYGIADVEKNTILYKMIRWSYFQGGLPTYGLLSSVSPDGKYILSTLNDNEFFVTKPDLSYSQLFFPIKGIIVAYDRYNDKFFSLPGADDTSLVQSNPTWSPDGKYIYFSRAKAIQSNESGFIDAFQRDSTLYKPFIEEFFSGKRKIKYDIYKIPFNNGKGGKAIPIEGASKNNMSNYFSKISPDGLWMVYTQAESFMLLQPDSKLYILPANGGIPRLMNCNMSNMNSWHSWSPNGKWLVFSSKEQGAYTKLYLTHIDKDGIDSPPILLEHLFSPEGASNIPEFVNISPGGLENIEPKFLQNDYFSYQNGVKKAEAGDYQGAIKEFDIAVKTDSQNFMVFGSRGYSKSALGEYESAIQDYNRALELKPNNSRLYNLRAFAKLELNDFLGAENDFNSAIILTPNDFESINGRGYLFYNQKKYDLAVQDFTKCIEINNKYLQAYYYRGLSKYELKDYHAAINDFNKVIKIDKSFGYAYYARGLARIMTGQDSLVCEDFFKAGKLGVKRAIEDYSKHCK